MSNIFIIAQHRTGSTLLKNIIDANSDVSMAHDEMNLYEPFRSNTLNKILAKNITSEELFNTIMNKQVHGTFWKTLVESKIPLIQFEKKLKMINKVNVAKVIALILNELQLAQGMNHSGVKYPIHVSKFYMLQEWFPEASFIFLTRNPNAIISSKLRDDATVKRKSKSFLHRFVLHYFTLLYFSIEYRIVKKVHYKFRNDIILIRYEELVGNSGVVVKKLCNKLNIKFESTMLEVTGKKSSHSNDSVNSLSTNSIYEYKKILSKFDRFLILIFAGKEL